MHRRRLTAGVLGSAAALVTAVALTPSAGAAPAATHSGPVTFHSVDENNGKTVDIVTGAIVDHGSDHSVGEKYEKIVLSKGTFEVYAAKFNKSFKVTFNKQACYATGQAHGTNLAISHGTGAYAGITGSISITASFSDLGVVKNGKCQNLNHATAGSVDSFSGTGHVAY